MIIDSGGHQPRDYKPMLLRSTGTEDCLFDVYWRSKVNEMLNVSKHALARLVGDVLFPNPDDPGTPHHRIGPWGPHGPQASSAVWVMLNPQPIPPGKSEREKPADPSPWRATVGARTLIDRALATVKFASVLENPKQVDRLIELTRGELNKFVDDWCGTPTGRPPKGPHPWPLLGAGAQFFMAAPQFGESPLGKDFENAADRLFQAGLQTLT